MAEKYDEEKSAGAGNGGYGNGDSPQFADTHETKAPWNRRFVDSFKRDPNAIVSKPNEAIDPHTGAPVQGRGGFDHAAAAERTANSGLAKKLKGRHMQMIAIGGSIGKPAPDIYIP
jgi:amino acid transporter